MWNYFSLTNTIMLVIILLIVLPPMIKRMRIGRNTSDEYIHTLGSNISMELSPLAHIVIDSYNNITFANPATEALFEQKEADFIHKSANALIGIGIDLRNLITQTDTNKGEEAFITTKITKTKIPVEFMAWRWKEPGGTMQFYTCVIKDISHRQLTEKTKKETYRYIMDSVSLYKQGEDVGAMGIWIWNLETNMVTVTFGFNIIFETDKFIYHSDELFDRVDKDDVANVRQAVETALEEGTGYEITYHINRRNNVKILIHCIAKVNHDSKGEPVSVIGVARDARYYKLQIAG